ncbi:MAG: hypothetical protein HYT66_00015 [Candidatus Yanofskybacteria bacterium]|nr:hypothetical protein [Candidatus Yanofskybacteria bacterium]
MKSTVDKKVIGFDMDGVIIDHVANKLFVAEKFGIKVTKDQTPSDIMRELVPRATWENIQTKMFDDPTIALTPPLMPGVVNVLRKLKQNNVPYFLISRRKKPDRAIELLRVRGLWPKYFNERNSFFVMSKQEKDIKSSKLRLTHYFDDQNSVLKELLSVRNRFLFDNLKVFKRNPYPTVSSWKEISELI